MKKIVFVIFILLLNNVTANIIDEASTLEEKILDFIDDDDTLIVQGEYASNSEKLTLFYLKENYPKIKKIPEISEAEFKEFSGTIILLGGPTQNELTNNVINDPSFSKNQDKLSFGIITFLTGNKKYLVFSDQAGYNNLPRTSAQKSPLANFMPVAFVPAAATAISFSLLWLWNLFGKIFSKVIRKIIAAKILIFFRKKSIKEKYKGFHISGIRIKYREWISITTAAVIFALAISYSYFQKNTDFFAFLLSNALVNIIIYAIRHITRLYMDKHHDLHTEYHIWWFGAIATIFSGWLGNTFSLAGYVVSDETKQKKEGKIKYIINIMTIFVAVIFFIWNFISPSILIQMSMILALAIGYLQMLPFKPFGGRYIYRWRKGLWWLTFIPLTLFYIVVNLII